MKEKVRIAKDGEVLIIKTLVTLSVKTEGLLARAETCEHSTGAAEYINLNTLTSPSQEVSALF